ncbi:MAG: alpha/beta fold hydrolase, partial [Acidobacteria bacterium]|nr:alpha/beta fold hydrolase [Acidobacteriota bacterium]
WTENGKLDRAELERRARAAPQRTQRGRPLHGAVEHQLARLFEELLGVEVETAGADFFALGGHSLLAVRLASRIERELGAAVPLAALVAAPTVEALAARLESASRPRTSCLVQLAEGPPADPLFLVHPVGGAVLCYREIAAPLAALGPVYAFEAPGLDGREQPLDHIETMAQRYLDTVAAELPAPAVWRLGGWSLGGVVAFEMARRLERRGEAVAPVLLLDSWLPEDAAVESPETDLVPAFVRNLGLSASRLAAIRHVLSGESPEEPDLELQPEVLRPLFAAFESHSRALRRYRPGPFEGSVRLFEAKRRPAAVVARAADGWRRWIRGGLEVETTDGDHFSMIEGAAARRLVERLLEVLAADTTRP